MQVQVKINARTICTVEGDTPKDIFTKLAQLEQVFGLDECGSCHGPVQHIVREVSGGFAYFQLQCQNCQARFTFGQAKEGNGILFPQRKDKAGNWKPNGGWEAQNYDGSKQIAHKHEEAPF